MGRRKKEIQGDFGWPDDPMETLGARVPAGVARMVRFVAAEKGIGYGELVRAIMIDWYGQQDNPQSLCLPLPAIWDSKRAKSKRKEKVSVR